MPAVERAVGKAAWCGPPRRRNIWISRVFRLISPGRELRFIHRRTEDTDIYFVANTRRGFEHHKRVPIKARFPNCGGRTAGGSSAAGREEKG